MKNVFIDKIDSKGNFALPAIAIKVGIKALIGAAVNGLSQIVLMELTEDQNLKM